MSKSITLSKLKTALAPLIALIDKKAETPNWNENDPTSKSYIADRPFYTATGLQTTILSEQEVFQEASATINEPLVVGQTYTITFDGVDYTCVCKNYDGYRMLGNNAIYEFDNGNTTDTGEPFACETDGDDLELVFYFNDSTLSPMFKITTIGSKVVKIPEKYLPDLKLAPVATSGSYNDLDDLPTIYTDVIRYNVNQNLTEAQQTRVRNNIGVINFSGSYNDLSDKPNLDSPKNSIAFIDQVNGYTYFACMREGNFVTYCAAKSIEVTALPTKTEYVDGECFDPTGMIITAIAHDGTKREITNYTYSSNCLSKGTTFVEIEYIEAGATLITNVSITVNDFDVSVALVDFEYTDNGNSTYTLTGWKGTYNGQASTEIIIPNNKHIIV